MARQRRPQGHLRLCIAESLPHPRLLWVQVKMQDNDHDQYIFGIGAVFFVAMYTLTLGAVWSIHYADEAPPAADPEPASTQYLVDRTRCTMVGCAARMGRL